MPKPSAHTYINISTNLRLFGQEHQLSFRVPQKPCRWNDVLEQLQYLTDEVVSAGTAKTIREGKPVSCGKGCGICCSQIVPISEVEAFVLRDLIRHLPAMRRKIIYARFATAQQHFEKVGLWSRLINPDAISVEEYQDFSLEYFSYNIPCPFLDEGSCSIHPQRPLVCREYLVTNDPIACANPGNGKVIDGVELPSSVSDALKVSSRSNTKYGWVPMIAILKWTENKAMIKQSAPGQELLRTIIESMTARPVT
ncbi:MAG: YkgJ family cysteine cluster protein [Deltaproteobacteria bacterium]|nr:YkgJ family cysteine cluster protein [Deltaproteobacteria bacterium]